MKRRSLLPGLLLPLAACGSPSSDLPSAKASQLALGISHACALTTDGGVRCWGENDYGQIGNGGELGQTERHLPEQVLGLESGVTAISASSEAEFTCALQGGHVFCWGSNEDMQLGDGTTDASSTPLEIPGISDAIAIGAGGAHACAVLADHTVKCWGNDNNSQVGDGWDPDATRHDIAVPTTVRNLTGATALAAGVHHTCALTGGTVTCWGDTSDGQAGVDDEFMTTIITPAPVAGISGATAIAAGGDNSCALVAGGARCWGSNGEHELGNGGGDFPDDSGAPVEPTGLGAATSVAIGSSYGFAVVGGSVKWWGQFDGPEEATPADAPALPEPAAAVAVGGFQFACALTTAGHVYCWGDNTTGAAGYYDPDNGVNDNLEATAISSLD